MSEQLAMKSRLWALVPCAALAASCTSSSAVTGIDTHASQVTSDVPNVALNGVDSGGVKVQLLGGDGQRWASLPASLTAPGCAVAPTQALTDSAGTAHFVVTCAQPRLVDVAASLQLGGLSTPLQRTASLNFYPPSDARRALAPGNSVNLQLVATGTDGAIDPSYQGRVRFTSSDPAASLPGDLRMTADMRGIAQLVAAATLRTLGEQTVTAVDTNSQRPLAHETFLVSRGVGQATCEAPPTTAVAGQPLSLTVVGLRDDGSPDLTFGHQVLVSSSDPAASLPPPYTFTAAAKGRYVMQQALTLFTAGPQTLSITDQQTGVLRSLPVEVAAAATDHIKVACAEQLVAGAGCPLSVAAYDAYGNLAKSYTGQLRLSCSDPLAELPASVTLTQASGGRAAAGSLTSHASGLVTLTATDSQQPGLAGSLSIAVTPAATQALHLTLPASAVAGQTLSGSMSSADGLGNLTPDYRGSLHFSASHGRTLLPGAVSLGAADSGQRQLINALVIYDAGTEQVEATDLDLPSLSAQTTVAVQPAAATAVIFEMAATQTAGVAADVNVLVADAYGNVCPSFTGTLLLSSSDPAATLPGGGSLLFLVSDAGRKKLAAGVVFRTSGSQNVVAQASVGGGVGGVGASQISPGPLDQVRVENLPASSVVTQPLSPRLRLVDAFGNTLTSYAGSLSLSATPVGTTLPASAAITAANAGSITLTDALIPTAIGPLTLSATESASALVGSASSTIGHGCWRYGDANPFGPAENHFRLSLAMDSAFRPAIAYDVGVPLSGATSTIMAQGWDGSSWHGFGAAAAVPFSDPTMVDQRLRFDRNDAPVVAASDVGPIFFLRRSGATWQPLASGVLSAPLNVNNFLRRRQYDIGIDATNAPWLVAEVDTGGGANDLNVLIFTGGAWTPPPAGSALRLSAANTWPSLAFDASGVPTLAWASSVTGNSEIFVARGANVASGGSWVGPATGAAYDNISNNSSTSTAPVVALDATGQPTVAWQDDISGSRQVFVLRFNGATWETLGASASGAGISRSSSQVGIPELAIDSQGYPVVTWINAQGAMMRRWNGSAWVEEYGSATGDGVSPTPSLNLPVAVDAQDRAVMFFENSGARVCSWR